MALILTTGRLLESRVVAVLQVYLSTITLRLASVQVGWMGDYEGVKWLDQSTCCR